MKTETIGQQQHKSSTTSVPCSDRMYLRKVHHNVARLLIIDGISQVTGKGNIVVNTLCFVSCCYLCVVV